MVILPSYIGQLSQERDILGTAFWVDSGGWLATCYHVVAADMNSPFSYQSLDGAQTAAVTLTQFVDPAHDLALLHTQDASSGIANLPPLIPSHQINAGTKFQVIGCGQLVDRGFQYEHTSAIGEVVGLVRRNQIDLLQLDSKQILPGMSGAPVMTAAGIIGVVSGRYSIDPSTQTWMQDTVWAARSEDLIALLRQAPGSTAPDARQLDLKIVRALQETCNQDDIRLLAFELGISDQNLRGETLTDQALSLVETARRTQQTVRLIAALCRLRPFLAGEFN